MAILLGDSHTDFNFLTGGEPSKVVASDETSVTGHSGESIIASKSATGFSLGHGFLFIPPKLVAKILKWEYVSMAELLPDNQELAHQSTDTQRSASCSSKVQISEEEGVDRRLEGTGGIVKSSKSS